MWYLIPRVNTKWLNVVYQQFAQDAGVSQKAVRPCGGFLRKGTRTKTKKVLLVEDNAGWHRSKKVEVPEGIIVEFLPPYSPELQPLD